VIVKLYELFQGPSNVELYQFSMEQNYLLRTELHTTFIFFIVSTQTQQFSCIKINLINQCFALEGIGLQKIQKTELEHPQIRGNDE